MPGTFTSRVRRAARLGLSRALRSATTPVRALAMAAIRRRPALERRLGAQTWLWQPGWGRACHDRLYRTPDPYGVAGSAYEQAKFGLIMDTLAGVHAARTMEVGCGEGQLSRRLVTLTDELVGVDLSAAAIDRARAALAHDPRFRFERRTQPFEMPDGTFDLIVCADVLYYWDPATLRTGLDRLLARLRPGGRLMLAHWLGDFGQAGNGDAVHDLALAAPGARRLASLHMPGPLGADGPRTRLDLLAVGPATTPESGQPGSSATSRRA